MVLSQTWCSSGPLTSCKLDIRMCYYSTIARINIIETTRSEPSGKPWSVAWGSPVLLTIISYSAPVFNIQMRSCLASKVRPSTCDSSQRHLAAAGIRRQYFPCSTLTCVAGCPIPVPFSRCPSTCVWGNGIEARGGASEYILRDARRNTLHAHWGPYTRASGKFVIRSYIIAMPH